MKIWKWTVTVKKNTPSQPSVNKTESISQNFNSTNTCITVQAFDGGIVSVHVDSPNPEVASKLFEKTYLQVRQDMGQSDRRVKPV